MEILTPEQMAAVERRAIEAGEVTGRALMARAGAGILEALDAARPGLAPGAAAVFAGPGNNGGDGFETARRLKERGWRVRVLELGDPARRSGDDAAARADWIEAGGEAEPWQAGALAGATPDLFVDALFGGGLARPVGRELRDLGEGFAPGAVLAVDLPSGVHGADGRDMGLVRAADVTVTFHRERLGHHLGAGPAATGRLHVADIGLVGCEGAGETVRRIGRPDAAALGKAPEAHKYGHGHALILGGGVGRGGAARMAARGALRIGAGLATVGVPPPALQENASALDAVMLRAVKDAAALEAMLEDPRLSALALGPGHGIDHRTRAMAEVALASNRALVLDADALTVLGEDVARLARPGLVLTPHPGEFARLFPDLAEDEGDPVSRARAAAGRLGGAVLVLKGPATVVASAGAGVALRSGLRAEAAPWLATAGAGDVLTGMIAGLLARGRPAFDAASEAVWLHAEAGRRLGPGLIAEDLPEALPGLLRALGA